MGATTSVGLDRSAGRISARTLQGFAAAAEHADGVLLSSLSLLDVLEVRTGNSRYFLTVLDHEGRVLVQGGRYFPLADKAVLAGSTLGGSSLKVGWIGRGFCLEFVTAGRRIVTSSVREITKLGTPVF